MMMDKESYAYGVGLDHRGRIWSPGDGVDGFMETLDFALGPSGRHSPGTNTRMRAMVCGLLSHARSPEGIMPGPDDGEPLSLNAFRMSSSDGRSAFVSHDDYPIDGSGLVLPRFTGVTGVSFVSIHLDSLNVGEPERAYINPSLMYLDFIALTDDPEAAIAAMGFRRALALSTLSRFRIGGMGNMHATRRRMFDLALECAEDGDLDWMMNIIADTAGVEKWVGLPVSVHRYRGLPASFLMAV